MPRTTAGAATGEREERGAGCGDEQRWRRRRLYYGSEEGEDEFEVLDAVEVLGAWTDDDDDEGGAKTVGGS